MMKHALQAVVAVLALSLMLAAQAAQQPPAGQSAGAAQAQQPAVAVQPAGTRRPPQAKSQEEINAYNDIRRMGVGPQAEAAAKEFEAKFPQSELRALIYQNLMDAYQASNNAAKATEMGRKSVAADPENAVVLVLLANDIAEGTRETDLDRDQQYAEAMKYAQHALEIMDTGVVVAPGTPAERVTMMKQLLTAMAHSAMGFVELNRHNDPAAEQHLRLSSQLNIVQPDPMVYLRLAIALDHQSKYTDALVATNRVLELAPAGGVGDLARQEKDRLQKLTAPPKPPAAANPAPPAAQPTPTPAPQTPPKG